MAQLQDIPRLVSEFVAMAKAYLVQETVGAAKRLGRFAGLSLGAGLLWALAAVLLSVAGLRTLVDAFPESPYWEALAYLSAAVVLAIAALVFVRVVPGRRVPPPSKDAGS
jgi:hypothetical protein